MFLYHNLSPARKIIKSFALVLLWSFLDQSRAVSADTGPSDGARAHLETKVDVPQETFSRHLTVFFEHDSSMITPDMVRGLHDEIEKIRNQQNGGPQDIKIQIDGWASHSGSSSYNRSLSERRARAVRLYLQENFDFRADQIVHTGRGEDTTCERSSCEEQSWRTDLIVTWSGFPALYRHLFCDPQRTFVAVVNHKDVMRRLWDGREAPAHPWDKGLDTDAAYLACLGSGEPLSEGRKTVKIRFLSGFHIGKDFQLQRHQLFSVDQQRFPIGGFRGRGAIFDESQFIETIFGSSDLREIKARMAVFDESQFFESIFDNSDLRESRFVGTFLAGSSLRYSDLRRTDFTGADLRNADFRNAHLGEGDDSAKFAGADLSGAIWTNWQRCLPQSIGQCNLPKK